MVERVETIPHVHVGHAVRVVFLGQRHFVQFCHLKDKHSLVMRPLQRQTVLSLRLSSQDTTETYIHGSGTQGAAFAQSH